MPEILYLIEDYYYYFVKIHLPDKLHVINILYC